MTHSVPVGVNWHEYKNKDDGPDVFISLSHYGRFRKSRSFWWIGDPALRLLVKQLKVHHLGKLWWPADLGTRVSTNRKRVGSADTNQNVTISKRLVRAIAGLLDHKNRKIISYRMILTAEELWKASYNQRIVIASIQCIGFLAFWHSDTLLHPIRHTVRQIHDSNTDEITNGRIQT